MKVCIITPTRNAFTARVFYTEAKTLAKHYDVSIIAQNSKDETRDKIKVLSLKKPKNRFFRFFFSTSKAFNLARKEKADVYHIHDPEIIPLALLLKLVTRAKIIYDAHENYERKILNRGWIPKLLRKPVSFIFSLFERFSSRFFDYIFVADNLGFEKFKRINKNVEFIGNFPLLLKVNTIRRRGTKIKCVYAGTLSRDRGLYKMVEAMKHVKSNVELWIVGKFENWKDKEIIKNNKKITYLGEKPWPEVFDVLAECDIGLNLLQPVPAYIDSAENTTKIFEYMATELPVISSNFPGLRKIIEKNKAGICVAPENIKEIAKAIIYLAENKNLRGKMGKNGKKLVLKKYNWVNEGKKLLNVYKNLEKCQKFQ